MPSSETATIIVGPHVHLPYSKNFSTGMPDDKVTRNHRSFRVIEQRAGFDVPVGCGQCRKRPVRKPYIGGDFVAAAVRKLPRDDRLVKAGLLAPWCRLPPRDRAR